MDILYFRKKGGKRDIFRKSSDVSLLAKKHLKILLRDIVLMLIT